MIRQENSFYAFGEQLAGSPVTPLPTTPNINLYNGGSEWQAFTSNLPDYNQTFYRNYDPAIGRFVAVDPSPESADGMNVYQYAGNNPISNNDPLGAKSGQGGNEYGQNHASTGFSGGSTFTGFDMGDWFQQVGLALAFDAAPTTPGNGIWGSPDGGSSGGSGGNSSTIDGDGDGTGHGRNYDFDEHGNLINNVDNNTDLNQYMQVTLVGWDDAGNPKFAWQPISQSAAQELLNENGVDLDLGSNNQGVSSSFDWLSFLQSGMGVVGILNNFGILSKTTTITKSLGPVAKAAPVLDAVSNYGDYQKGKIDQNEYKFKQGGVVAKWGIAGGVEAWFGGPWGIFADVVGGTVFDLVDAAKNEPDYPAGPPGSENYGIEDDPYFQRP